MKFTVQTKTLKDALGKLSLVPRARDSLTGALAVQIEADAFGGLVLQRVTPEASIRLRCDAEIEADGKIAVNFEAFLRMASNCSQVSPVITAEPKALRIRSGEFDVKLVRWPEGEALRDFPDIDTLPISFDPKVLKDHLEVALAAHFSETGRDNLKGVCMRSVNDRLTILGTDGRRFHCLFSEETLEPVLYALDDKGNPTGFDKGALMSKPVVDTIIRCISDEAAPVKLRFSNTGGQLDTTEVKFKFTIPVDSPPDIAMFINPVPFDNEFKVDRSELIRSIKSSAPLAFGDSNMIHLDFGTEAMTVIADDAKGNECHERIKCTSKRSQRISVNADFMHDLLQGAKSETVTLGYLSAMNTINIREDDRSLTLSLIRIQPK